MTYKELQNALKSIKLRGLSDIRLNVSKEELQAEYDRTKDLKTLRESMWERVEAGEVLYPRTEEVEEVVKDAPIVHSAKQGGFYSNGIKIVEVKDVQLGGLTVTESIFGYFLDMSWETFKEYKLIDCERWCDVESYRENNYIDESKFINVVNEMAIALEIKPSQVLQYCHDRMTIEDVLIESTRKNGVTLRKADLQKFEIEVAEYLGIDYGEFRSWSNDTLEDFLMNMAGMTKQQVMAEMTA